MTAPTTLRTAGIAAAREYRELPAWQRAISLAEKVYAFTDGFPEREQVGLASNMRQSAVAIAASIAAGSGRNNEQGVADSYSKAQSANAELSTQYELAMRLGFGTENASISALLDEISRLLIGMKHGLKLEAKDRDRSERDQGKRDREHKERNERPDRPRGEFKDRGERKPKGEWKPREDRGERKPKGEWKPREGGERKPRGEWKPREDRGGRPSGDRPHRKPYKKD